MLIADLFDRLHAAGTNLELDDDDGELYLDLEGPPPDLLAFLRAHKPALRAELIRTRLDFETASLLNITGPNAVSPSTYAEHPSTRVLLMTWCTGDGPIRVWQPGEPLPEELRTALERGGPIVAHGAQFDCRIWNAHQIRLGWPPLLWSRWSCTSIRARLQRLPGSLAELGKVLELSVQKDAEGAKLMRELAKTAYRGAYEPTVAQINRLATYSCIDTDVLRQLDRLLPELDADRRAEVDFDHAMNRRGFPTDVDAVRKLIKVRDAESERLIARMRAAIGLRPTQTAKLLPWLNEHGAAVENLQRETLERWLEQHLDDDSLAAQMVRIRSEFAPSSDAKLQRILDEAADSGLVRDAFITFGAHTLRWSSRDIQLHNFPREKLDDTEATLHRLLAAAESDDPARVPDDGSKDARLPVKVQLAGTLRAVFRAPAGERFVCVDLSQIEARVLAWLAGQQDVLGVFADAAQDIYVVTAAKLGSQDRQFGKLIVLSLGFGAGAQTLLKKAPGFGLKLTPERAEQAKNDWRAANPKIVQFWFDLRDAVDAVMAMPLGIPPVPVGSYLRVYRTAEALHITLPSGRDAIYPQPRYAPSRKFEDEDVFVVTLPQKGKLTDKEAWFGLLTENVVQSVARDILVADMLVLHQEDVRIAGSIHDEVIAIATEDQAAAVQQRMVEVLSTPPAWAPGLPLAAEGYNNQRFIKPKKSAKAASAADPAADLKSKPVPGGENES
jgi:DNA polymerase